jgi:hypothetical protein
MSIFAACCSATPIGWCGLPRVVCTVVLRHKENLKARDNQTDRIYNLAILVDARRARASSDNHCLLGTRRVDQYKRIYAAGWPAANRWNFVGFGRQVDFSASASSKSRKSSPVATGKYLSELMTMSISGTARQMERDGRDPKWCCKRCKHLCADFRVAWNNRYGLYVSPVGPLFSPEILQHRAT